MRNLRFNYKRISVWIILLLQVVLISCYFLLPPGNATTTASTLTPKVSFLKLHDNRQSPNITTYRTIHNKIKLPLVATISFYDDFNSSLCYKMGTDLKAMHRSNHNWKCNCLSGWHGNDCGQPEVIWRALLAYRKPLTIKGPRKYQRRIIYVAEVTQFDLITTEIRVNELHSFVDLFVLYENSPSNFLHKKLESQTLHEYVNKILYINSKDVKDLWSLIKSTVVNLKDDDVVMISKSNEIPNGLALQYMKLYDKWPQPIKFRFRWSVYGYFWLHPSKTILKGGASDVAYLYETYGDQIEKLYKNDKFLNKGLIIGDLNHFGGWYCEFCYDSLKIIDYLNSSQSQTFDNTNKKQIDNSYVEDMIENGIYLDTKSELLRAHRYSENYYAPNFVTNNSWKYDWLLSNLYSKLDYY